MTENLPILRGKTLSLIALFGLYMRLLDSISILNSRQGIELVELEQPKLLNRDRLNLDCTFSEKVIPCLEFSIEFQSNQLIYQKEYTKHQQFLYILIKTLQDKGYGYRRIAHKLNDWGVKATRG